MILTSQSLPEIEHAVLASTVCWALVNLLTIFECYGAWLASQHPSARSWKVVRSTVKICKEDELWVRLHRRKVVHLERRP